MSEPSDTKKQRKWDKILNKLDSLKFVIPPSTEETKLKDQAERLCE